MWIKIEPAGSTGTTLTTTGYDCIMGSAAEISGLAPGEYKITTFNYTPPAPSRARPNKRGRVMPHIEDIPAQESPLNTWRMCAVGHMAKLYEILNSDADDAFETARKVVNDYLESRP